MPRGITLRAPIDSLNQGQAYGTAYIRGRDAYNAREKINMIMWDACDKAYAAAMVRYDDEIVARTKAILAAKELDK